MTTFGEKFSFTWSVAALLRGPYGRYPRSKLPRRPSFDQFREEAAADEELRQAGRASTIQDFKLVFNKALEGFFIDRTVQTEELSAKSMNDKAPQRLVEEYLSKEV